MNRQKHFLLRRKKREEEMEGKFPAEDGFWVAAALLTFSFAQLFSWISKWNIWYLLAAGAVSIYLMKEVQRLRFPLSPEQKRRRRVSLFMIFCLIIACLTEFIGMFLPK